MSITTLYRDMFQHVWTACCLDCHRVSVRIDENGKPICDWCPIERSERFWHFEDGRLVIDMRFAP